MGRRPGFSGFAGIDPGSSVAPQLPAIADAPPLYRTRPRVSAAEGEDAGSGSQNGEHRDDQTSEKGYRGSRRERAAARECGQRMERTAATVVGASATGNYTATEQVCRGQYPEHY